MQADMSTTSLERKTTHEQHIQWLRQAAAQPRSMLSERIDRAWGVAHQAARLLRQRYGVTRVRVFGSLFQPSQFHTESDVALVVEGLAVDDYWMRWRTPCFSMSRLPSIWLIPTYALQPFG